MALFLGVDGGQSSTTALISDEAGRVLGRGTGGPCNHITGPEARTKFAGAMHESISSACQMADLDYVNTRFEAAFLGLSGGTEDKETYARELIPAHQIRVTHDAEIALMGALAGKPGVIVISGTGSIAFGRSAGGVTARAGGWGYIFGDEGSAFHIVRQALRASLRAEEGWGPDTSLRALLLARTGEPTANKLMHKCYGMARSHIATLAPLVSQAAEAGDPEAAAILDQSAQSLVEYAAGVSRALFRGNCPALSYIGGTFASNGLRSSFVQHADRLMRVQAIPPEMPPVAGALLGALLSTGIQATLSNLAPQTK